MSGPEKQPTAATPTHGGSTHESASSSSGAAAGSPGGAPSGGGGLGQGPHKVTATWLNLRREPRKHAGNIVTAVPHGTVLTVNGTPTRGYYPVQHGTVQAFAYGAYLEKWEAAGMAAVHRMLGNDEEKAGAPGEQRSSPLKPGSHPKKPMATTTAAPVTHAAVQRPPVVPVEDTTDDELAQLPSLATIAAAPHPAPTPAPSARAAAPAAPAPAPAPAPIAHAAAPAPAPTPTVAFTAPEIHIDPIVDPDELQAPAVQQQPVPPPPTAAIQAKPDIEDTQAALGEHVAAGMGTLNSPDSTTVEDAGEVYLVGVQYTYNFRGSIDLLHKVLSNPDKYNAKTMEAARTALAQSPIAAWNDDYYLGYANPDYFDRLAFMHWRIKPGKSASAAVRAWLKGLTLGECNTAMTALEYDAARAAMGDDAFDRAFNGKLEIAPNTPVLNPLRIDTDAAKAAGTHNQGAGTLGHRPAQVGDWYYFCNHPRYLLKHPGGAWQGENAILAQVRNGVQYWAGLGAANMTEDSMMDEMVEAYNGDRDADDDRAIADVRRRTGNVPDELDAKKKHFPDKITKKDILTAPPFQWLGQTRTGGFDVHAGQRVDTLAVASMAKLK